MRAGVIGIGDMGSGLAKNLMKNGFETAGWDIAGAELYCPTTMFCSTSLCLSDHAGLLSVHSSRMNRVSSLMMNWFKARGELSSGVVEGFNNKAKRTMRKSYGFRTFKGIEIALYHAMGNLPEPKFTHRFF